MLPSFLKNLESLYSQDELVEDSLIEAIKNKIEDELVGNINALNYVDLVKKDEDRFVDFFKSF